MDTRASSWIAASLALALAGLQAAYVAAGGIADPPALAWTLVAIAAAGALLMVASARSGRRPLAWAGLGLLAIPLVVTLPAPLASPGGLLAVLLLAATAATLAAAGRRRPAAAPPAT